LDLFDDASEVQGLFGVGLFVLKYLNFPGFAGNDLSCHRSVALEEGMGLGVFGDFVEDENEINSLIIELVVFRQYPGVLLFLQPVLQDVVVGLLGVPARPYFLVLFRLRHHLLGGIVPALSLPILAKQLYLIVLSY